MHRIIVFRDGRQIAAGPIGEVAPGLKAAPEGWLALDLGTGRVVDLDLSGTAAEIAARYTPEPAPNPAPGPAARPGTPRGRGRPRLGVSAREVTLLPRHWDWLATQPGGASAALRRLVETASRAARDADARRAAQEATYHAMQALAGDLPGYEEALRALFARDRTGFEARLTPWPTDLKTFFLHLAGPVLAAEPTPGRADIPSDECD